jgi:hypothetical protein
MEQKGAGVVIEADGVVEPGGLRGHLAEPPHAFGAVVEPPGRAELQRRIGARKRRQFPRVAGLVQREDDDRQILLQTHGIQKRLERADIVGAGRNIEALVAAEGRHDRAE